MILETPQEKRIVDDYVECSKCSYMIPTTYTSGLCRSCQTKKRYLDYKSKHLERRKESLRRAALKKRMSLSWAERALKPTGYYRLDRRKLIRLSWLEDLVKNTPLCKCCYCILDYGYFINNIRPTNAATLDKIIPSIGYRESNVSIICRDCNLKKGKLTLSSAKMVVAYLESVLGVSDENRLTT